MSTGRVPERKQTKRVLGIALGDPAVVLARVALPFDEIRVFSL